MMFRSSFSHDPRPPAPGPRCFSGFLPGRSPPGGPFHGQHDRNVLLVTGQGEGDSLKPWSPDRASLSPPARPSKSPWAARSRPAFCARTPPRPSRDGGRWACLRARVVLRGVGTWGHPDTPQRSSQVGSVGSGKERAHQARHQHPGLRTLASSLTSQHRLPVCETGTLTSSPVCPSEQRTAASCGSPAPAHKGQLLEEHAQAPGSGRALYRPQDTHSAVTRTRRRLCKACVWAATGTANLPAA